MNTLFVAWQQPDSGEWIPVAKLEKKNELYCFSYTQGAYRAHGFLPFSRMDHLDAVYESSSIFPLFANRLISKSRPEFKDYLRWLGRENMEDSAMAMLALTGGIRGTDSIELFQPPSGGENGEYQVDFFIRSLSHMPKEALFHIAKLVAGEKLLLMKDCQNDFDSLAVALRSDNPAFFLGFCPKYYARDLVVLLSTPESRIDVRVKCVNIDAPLNMRLLCTVTGIAPTGFVPLSGEDDFQPIVEPFPPIPGEWRKLSSSLESIFKDERE
jgi:hypothetical protein